MFHTLSFCRIVRSATAFTTKLLNAFLRIFRRIPCVGMPFLESELSEIQRTPS
jgi:hypothetical protein